MDGEVHRVMLEVKRDLRHENRLGEQHSLGEHYACDLCGGLAAAVLVRLSAAAPRTPRRTRLRRR